MAGDERTQTVMAVRTTQLRALFVSLGKSEVFEASIVDFGGQLIQSEEGWTVAIFRSATAALDAAASVQILAARPATPVSPPSMALDLGDLRNSGVGWVGAAIDNAVRLAECATEGQVVVSRSVAVLSGSTEHRFSGLNVEVADAFGVPRTSQLLDWQQIEPVDPLIRRRSVAVGQEETVGRAGVFSALGDAVGRADVLGSGAEVIVLRGAAGSGKSRLLDDTAESSLNGRATAIHGRCRGRSTRPFDAIIDAVSPLVEASAFPYLQLWTRGMEVLPSLFPGMATRITSSGGSASRELDHLDGLVVELTRFLFEVARDTPFVLLLDDAQLLDDWSVEVLHRISTVSATCRPVIVLAADSAASSQSWSRFLGHVTSLPRTSVIDLAPFGPSDLSRLADSLGYDLSNADVAELQERTHGLVGQAVQALQEDQAGQLTPGVGMGAEHHLSEISTDVRRIAEAAALCGDRFDLDVVALAAGVEEEQMQVLLAELEARLIVRRISGEASRDVWEFVDSETRSSIEASTNAVRLISLHEKLADAYAKLSRPDDLYHVAAHLDAARPRVAIEVVVEAWISAASNSLDIGEAHTAREAAERGLSTLAGAVNRDLEARLWQLVAQACVLVADYVEATTAAAAAAEAAAAAGNLTAFCEAAAIRVPRLYGDDNSTMIRLADRAVARFNDDLSLGLRARVLTARARHDRASRSDELSTSALSFARTGGSAGPLVDALCERLFAIAGWPEAQDEAHRLADELLTLPLEDLAVSRRVEALDAAALVKLESGDRRGFEELFRRVERAAVGSPSNALELLLDRRRSLRALLDGDWQTALRCSAESESRANHDYETDTVSAQVLWASLGQGRIDVFEAEVTRLRALGYDGDAERAAEAIVAFSRGENAASRSMLDDLLPIDPSGPGADCFSRSTVLAFLGRIASSCGSEHHARLLLEQMLPRAGTLLALPGVVVYGPADRWIGTLHTRLGEYDNAHGALDAALDAARRLGSAPCEARVLVSLADLYRHVGDETKAGRLTNEAWEISEAIGMKQLANQRESMHKGGTTGVPRAVE